MYVMFVSVMAFFSRISDPRFGGTYMTLLNTIANLANAWTSTVALGMVDFFTVNECSVDSKNHCSTKNLQNVIIQRILTKYKFGYNSLCVENTI